MPPKIGKVGRRTTFGGPIPYKEDDYNYKKVLLRKELEYHRSKVQEKPWSQNAKRLKFGTFNNPIDTIGEGKYSGKYAPKYGKPVPKNEILLKKSAS